MLLRSSVPTNLGQLFEWSAGQRGNTVMHLDRPFDILPDGGSMFDLEGLAGLVDRAAAWLYAAGVRFGNRVGIVKDNHYDVILLAAGAVRIGALPAMMAPISSLDGIRTMIARLEPKVLVAAASVLDRAAAAGVPLAGPDVTLVALGEPAHELPTGTLRLDDLCGARPAPVRFCSADEPMLVTHTSGTTGVPKLVVHSANSSLGAIPFRIESSYLPFMTSSHNDVVASGITFAHNRNLSWTSGQLQRRPRKLVIISDPGLDKVTRILAEHQPTSLEACPNVFQYWEELTERRPELFAKIRRFISTFDAVHPRTVRKFLGVSKALLPIWAWGVGQSEIAGISVGVATRRSVRLGNPRAVESTTVGWPPLVGARVIDPVTGRKQRRGQPGLVLIATKSRCLTYLGEDERHKAKEHGRWWNTGDLGEHARFGRIRLIDREVDMIPGMSCIDLESTLLDRLERASEVVVLGVLASLPVPVLCMRDNQLSAEEWRQATRGLPELGKPRLLPWHEVPRTATWKVRRVELREKLLGSAGVLGTGKWT